jgi:hypothetical protein
MRSTETRRAPQPTRRGDVSLESPRPRRRLQPPARVTKLVGLAVGFAALVVFLWPVTWTWYLGDDAFVAFSVDAAALHGESRVGYIVGETQRALERTGRFAPLGAVGHALYVLTPSVFAYKVGVVAITVLSIALAALLLSELGFGWRYAALLPVVLCAVIQLRYWHDPILAYAAAMPTLACLILGSLVAFARALRTGSGWLYAAALALFLASCLFWEGAPFLTAVYVPVAWAVDNASVRTVVRRTGAFGGVAAAFVVLILALRAGAAEETATTQLYQPSTSPRAIAAGLARQMSGSVPLSYFVAVARAPDDAEGIPPEQATTPYGAASHGIDVPPGFVDSERGLIRERASRPQGLLLTALMVLALSLLVPGALRVEVPLRSALATILLGLALVGGAALPLALSTRWQQETFWGVSYIPVYLQYLGVGIGIVALLALVLRGFAARRGASVAVAVAAAVVLLACASTTNALNVRVVEAFEGVKTVMSFNGDAVASGLLRPFEDAEELLLDETAPLSAWFLTVEDGAPVPPTTSLAVAAARYAECRASGPTCPAPSARIAYVSGIDRVGPWAAVCTVDEAASREAGAPLCAGRILLASSRGGGGDACRRLGFDAAREATHSADAASTLLRAVDGQRNVTLCEARLASPVVAQSIAGGERRDASEGPLRIVETHPAEARVGTPFNVQPDGQSAIAVRAVGATPTTRVVMDGVELPSRYVDSNLVTALVPDAFIEQPGRLEIRLRDRGVSSQPRYLVVTR